MTVDVSQVVTAVQGVAAPIAQIGVAVLLIVVGWKLYRWMASAIDAVYAEDEDGVAELYESGYALACDNCEYELDEDESYHAIDTGYCPKCGTEIV